MFSSLLLLNLFFILDTLSLSRFPVNGILLRDLWIPPVLAGLGLEAFGKLGRISTLQFSCHSSFLILVNRLLISSEFEEDF